VNGKWIVKSGTDFREFSHLVLELTDRGGVEVTIEKVEVTGRFAPDPDLKEALSKYESGSPLVWGLNLYCHHS
jgi:hypothetical protein